MRLIFLPFIISITFSAFSQKLADIPLTDSTIYYVFKEEFQNKKKCLKKYNDASWIQMIGRLDAKITGRYPKYYPWKIKFMTQTIENPHPCIDTLRYCSFGITIPEKSNYTDYTIIGSILNIGKKRFLWSEISAEPILIFTNDNQYELKFRKFIYKIYFTDGTISIIDLSEYYLKLLKEKSLTEQQIKMFNELDYLVKACNQVVYESFNFVIKNEELD
jgi:hypothetical protein